MSNLFDSMQRLCFVRSLGYVLEAFFTDADVARQWGDDWNDAPFEHNAGDPYPDWRDAEGTRHPATITRLIISGTWKLIGSDVANSPYCVEDINAGLAPWLLPDPVDFEPFTNRPLPEPIWAGTTQSEFIERIQATNGDIYAPLVNLDRCKLPTAELMRRYITACPVGI